MLSISSTTHSGESKAIDWIAKWPELYERFLPGWKELNLVTRADAENGFRRKVNKHRQRHQRLGKRL